MTLDEARALLAEELEEGLEVAPYGWEDDRAFWLVVLHPPFGEPSPDGGAVLVDKGTGALGAIAALENAARLASMSRVGDRTGLLDAE